MSQASSTSRFDRGARITLILTTALLIYTVGITAFRFTWPTDGWLSAEQAEIISIGYVYKSNIMGVPSGLRPGDLLVAVEGIPLAERDITALFDIREGWQAGNTVRYTVARGEQTVELDVPLTKWDVGEYLRATFTITDLVTYLGVFAFLGISLLAFWRRPDNPAARAVGPGDRCRRSLHRHRPVAQHDHG